MPISLKWETLLFFGGLEQAESSFLPLTLEFIVGDGEVRYSGVNGEEVMFD